MALPTSPPASNATVALIIRFLTHHAVQLGDGRRSRKVSDPGPRPAGDPSAIVHRPIAPPRRRHRDIACCSGLQPEDRRVVVLVYRRRSSILLTGTLSMPVA
ncbi:hypothetical protein [Lichenicoccus roseus]|uniref:Uncharacterized protein n=1 Tax=Lichenicoccus roseus TaxID=2683649 RepID=A0A5R9J2F2_9PROT|nr:hypothetical protein [Lichenicoccus roseus]TLU71804.1 hypothetical protein FE263_15180 [Lichenicoccus roseus]